MIVFAEQLYGYRVLDGAEAYSRYLCFSLILGFGNKVLGLCMITCRICDEKCVGYMVLLRWKLRQYPHGRTTRRRPQVENLIHLDRNASLPQSILPLATQHFHFLPTPLPRLLELLSPLLC